MKGDECFFLCRERGKYLSTIGYSKKKKKKKAYALNFAEAISLPLN